MKIPDDDLPPSLQPPWHVSLTAAFWMMTGAVTLVLTGIVYAHYQVLLVNPLWLGAVAGVGLLNGKRWANWLSRALAWLFTALGAGVVVCAIWAKIVPEPETGAWQYMFEKTGPLLVLGLAAVIIGVGVVRSARRKDTEEFFARADMVMASGE